MKVVSYRAIIFVVSLLLLSACDQQNESGQIRVDGSQANMSFTPPIQLLTSRSIDRANLILEVTIDGQTSRVEPNTAGVYEFKTTRPANSETTVTLLWSELIDIDGVELSLPLLRAEKELFVGSPSSPVVLTFASTEFESSLYDMDEDGVSNYDERKDGDDDAYNDPDDPVSPPIDVPIDVQLAMPVGMDGATAELRAAVTAQASVNSEQILLSREGDVWRGSTTVTENSEPLVNVEFHATSEQEILIARLARNQEIGGGGQVIFDADDYDEEINYDGDAFTNIQEIAIGSNPRDSSDPGGPVADAGADQTITSGASVTLNGSGSSSDSNSSIATYRWSEGTRVLGTGVSLVVPGLSVGVHQISLLVTDTLGLTDSDSVTVTVSAAPVPNIPPVADAGSDKTIGSGDPVAVSGAGSTDEDGTIESYVWLEGTEELANGRSTVLTGLSDGQHIITLRVTDDDGDTDTDTVTITVTAAPIPNQSPDADAGEDQTIDSGDSVTLDGSGSGDVDGTISLYQWFEGPVELATGSTPVIAGLSDGEHTILLRVTDDDGSTDTDTVVVTVTAAPNVAPVADAGVDKTIGSGDPVAVNGSGSTDEDGTIVSYVWLEGTDELSTGRSTVLTGLSDGEHTITLRVTDDDAAFDTDTVIITVTAAPIPNQAPIADAGEDQTIDSGDPVTLDGSDSSDQEGDISSYRWTEGGVTLGIGVSPTITGLSDGEHVILLTVIDEDGAPNTDTVTITVRDAPVENLPPEADAGEPQTVDSGEPVTMDGRDSTDQDGSISSYEWFEDTTLLGTGVRAVLTGLGDGEHLIVLVVTDEDGDTGNDTVAITVRDAPVENLPPTAIASAEETVDFGDPVTLDGSASTDDDGTIAAYEWTEDATVLGTEEIVEVTGLSEGPHTILLLVTDDDGDSGSDTVSVDVLAAAETNVAPMANAGADQTIALGESVLLDGSASSDDSGFIASYDWFQGEVLLDSGAMVEIENLGEGLNVIELVVTDDEGATGMDSVSVTVTAAGENASDESTAIGSDASVNDARTSATGGFVARMQTLV